MAACPGSSRRRSANGLRVRLSAAALMLASILAARKIWKFDKLIAEVGPGTAQVVMLFAWAEFVFRPLGNNRSSCVPPLRWIRSVLTSRAKLAVVRKGYSGVEAAPLGKDSRWKDLEKTHCL